MRLVVFARRDSSLNQRLRQMLAGLTGRWEILSCSTQEELTRALMRPDDSQAIVLLVAAEGGETDSLGWLGEMRYKLKLVLILSDHDPRTIHQAHALQPRFIAYADGDLRDLVKVLEHISQREPRRSTSASQEIAHASFHP